MTITCIQQDALHCTSGSSDKLYVLQLTQDDWTMEYCTTGYYGRRGSTLKAQVKYIGKNRAAAVAAYDKVQGEKMGAKGYHPVSGIPLGLPAGTPIGPGATSASSAPRAPKPAPVATGSLPMLPKVLHPSWLADHLRDDNFGVQRKHDGERCTIRIRRGSIQAFNRNAVERSLSAPIINAIEATLWPRMDFADDRVVELDGEDQGDSFAVFDILEFRSTDVRHLSFLERSTMVEDLVANGPALFVVETAWTHAEKVAMLARAEAEDWEGLIFRDIDSGYEAGPSNNVLKHKLWATATVRIGGHNAVNSVRVFVREDDGSDGFVGNVTVSGTLLPAINSIWEVRYLYCMEGGSLYQPNLIRQRTDTDVLELRSALKKAPPEKRPEAIPA